MQNVRSVDKTGTLNIENGENGLKHLELHQRNSVLQPNTALDLEILDYPKSFQNKAANNAARLLSLIGGRVLDDMNQYKNSSMLASLT